jgi:hypothetical protein
MDPKLLDLIAELKRLEAAWKDAPSIPLWEQLEVLRAKILEELETEVEEVPF